LNCLSTDLKQNYFKDTRTLSYYDIRCRYLNIVHIGIRNTCSALHNALFHANLIPNPYWSCGYSTENAEQFIFLLEIFAQKNILLRSHCVRLYILSKPYSCLLAKFLHEHKYRRNSLLYRQILRKHVLFR